MIQGLGLGVWSSHSNLFGLLTDVLYTCQDPSYDCGREQALKSLLC